MASGYDKTTAFFDCIYVQDATGGVCCFPIAGDFKLGDVVRVTATTHFFQGEAELQVVSAEKLGETTPVEPTRHHGGAAQQPLQGRPACNDQGHCDKDHRSQRPA